MTKEQKNISLFFSVLLFFCLKRLKMNGCLPPLGGLRGAPLFLRACVMGSVYGSMDVFDGS